jgi:hypothetical protein
LAQNPCNIASKSQLALEMFYILLSILKFSARSQVVRRLHAKKRILTFPVTRPILTLYCPLKFSDRVSVRSHSIDAFTSFVAVTKDIGIEARAIHIFKHKAEDWSFIVYFFLKVFSTV